MKRISTHLPSPAMMVSLLALFLALGGGSFAVASHLKVRASDIQNDAVRTKHIKNGQVRTPDLAGGAVATGKLRGGAVKGGKLANNAVNSDKVADNSLTGADIDEGSLGKVPSAANADNANTANSANAANSAANADKVNGMNVRRISLRTGQHPSPTRIPIVSLEGLTLRAQCWSSLPGHDAGTALTVTANTDTDGSYIRGLPNTVADYDFNVSETHHVKVQSDNDGAGVLVYRNPSGAVVTVTLAYHEVARDPNCELYGTVVGG